MIEAALASNEAERKDAVKQGKAIFGFKLKNEQGQEEAWHLDLKETGKVGKGEAPEGKKADGECGQQRGLRACMTHWKFLSPATASDIMLPQSLCHYQTRTLASWSMERQRLNHYS